ncbi:DNA methyltransferase [Rufibacter sp. XAAS-G3-1]|uniref:DNA methyltransferase n=1 Tax=Rufibacter sp. XAAS-G3-1 TaxID=2729134 RepID=UPI0015E7C7CE|nr:DNA methyltransferase [Rufibacter sp. XAAS-G3-1]
MLSYSERKPRLDANGQPVTRWDGHSTKPHPVTGQEVPDETARTITYDYLDPKPATWPEADFIVGNPPFIGDKTMRSTLGDGYVDALRKVYKGTVPESADFVMFWWQKAAEIVQAEKAERFGFITTNSIKQPFNRRVIQAFFDSKKPLNLDYAIPDHPWIDSADGAQVRIAVTVASLDSAVGRVDKVFKEIPAEGEWKVSFTEKIGTVNPDLTVGADLTSTVSLNANSNLSSVGMGLYGTGFLITLDEAKKLGRGEIEGMESVIKPYLNGRDFTQTSRGLFVIDLFGYTEEQARTKFPQVYQHVLNNVKPERDQNNRASYRKNWWYFGEARATFRPSLKSLDRYIITTVIRQVYYYNPNCKTQSLFIFR